MVDSEVCPVCDGTGLLLDTSCPLCEDAEDARVQQVPVTSEHSGNPFGCVAPAALDAEDLAVTLSDAIERGKSSMKRLRRHLNGDPSLIYSVDDSGETVHISRDVWQRFEELFLIGQEDNRERPFVVVMDESRKRAVAAVIDKVGDESCCEHTEDGILRAHAIAQDLCLGSSARLSFGHTHPVFWPELNIAGPYGSTMGCGSGLPASDERRFGCFPSCIFIGQKDWLDAKSRSRPESHAVIDKIINEKLYKRYGADYCCFLCRQELYCDPLGVGTCSNFEWIVSPRLRQVGCFRAGEGGSITYIRWVVEES
eukprot:gnl/TRDRNA2_/TRDRNA2_29654_c0_seq1.p1 gnl/TRDRNA2_/TRDRNA2_29654_c0~~gnl/TRDRNA2_/TRDRNA2_29654_c0_seq1.p1  ORF type:complete len:311 (+),score=29.82 gnl/TRDRNA2_/TRDRNA2_29654_c0_seq1:64-996(+)